MLNDNPEEFDFGSSKCEDSTVFGFGVKKYKRGQHDSDAQG